MNRDRQFGLNALFKIVAASAMYFAVIQYVGINSILGVYLASFLGIALIFGVIWIFAELSK